MHGLGWELFVKHTSLHGGVVLLVFTTTGPKPRISVAFTEHGNNEQDSEEDYTVLAIMLTVLLGVMKGPVT